MADDFSTISNNILLFAPSLDIAQAQQITQMAFARFAERRIWSWLVGSSCFVPVDIYQGGTATVTQGSANVTGSGTAWTAAMQGRQFRVGLYTPIYTISSVTSPTTLVLDQAYAPVSASGVTYFIYQAYFPTPVDFREFLTLKDPQNNNYRLNHNITQNQLDAADAQRSNFQFSLCASFLDYVGISQGQVGAIQQVSGSGPSPMSSSPSGFTYPASATYVVTISTGGAPGGALAFTWFRISNGISTASVGPVSVIDSSYMELSDGVGVYFPAGTYTANNVFTMSAAPSSSQQQARYELWPHPTNSVYNYPYLYFKRVPPFDANNPQLPPMIRLDVILEIALEMASMMPGTAENPNSFYGIQNYQVHHATAETLIYELEKRDDETASRDIRFSSDFPFTPNPFLDGAWVQSHAAPYYGGFSVS